MGDWYCMDCGADARKVIAEKTTNEGIQIIVGEGHKKCPICGSERINFIPG